MVDILNHITKLESRHKHDAAGTIVLALRCWQAYRFLEPEHEMRIHLQRANHSVVAAHRRNLVHMELYTLAIFIAIESGHHDSANEMLDKAMAFKSFLKSSEPFYYGVLCFLYGYLELNQRRIRSAKKHRRALTDHIKSLDAPSPHYTVMQGLLHLAAGEYPEAYKFLTEALLSDVNSVFLYEGLYRYYKNASSGFEGMSILPVLIYAATRGAEIGLVAAKYPETLSAAIAADPIAGEKLYQLSKYPPILQDICKHRIKNNDMSREAYHYYREAEKKQVFTRELFYALIRAAYENNVQKLNHYPIKKFLANLPPDGITDPEFAVYVYHFLLSDPTLSDVLPEAQTKILQLGTRCLENNVRGRYANSIYHYLWSRFRALGIQGAQLVQAEEILRENITLYELHTEENSAVRFVYVTESEKRGMEVYELASATSPLIIEAVATNIHLTCLGAGQRTVIGEEVTIRPMVENASHELYLHFFQKGDRRFNLIANLANYYLSQDTPPDEATPVFEAVLQEKNIKKPYKMRILIALGGLHYNAFSFEQALECYSMVEEVEISDEYTEQVLAVYLQTREYARAAKLIATKHKSIPNEILFDALNTLIVKNEKTATTEIAYNLLMDNFYSEELLAYVLEHHNASYSEWANLSRLLDEENHPAPSLDVRVLESALYMSSFDKNAQKAFARLHLSDPENKLIADFTELATFEMLANHTRPSYDVISILEKLFLESTEPSILLACGLSTIYLGHNITTFKSEEIINHAIAALESEGILFPVFKESKSSPFIKKFRPFMYKSLPNKDCRLYYRIDDSSSYTSVPMQYVRYGLYVAAVPMFYNETFTYYFSEEMASGSITTREESVKNNIPFLHEDSDQYFTINNAIIYEQMFKHDQVEKLISRLVKDIRPVRSQLL
ncbi:MAG: DUF5717 family protein [Defluviitaleaceae bacterium]|nr:DUF5717 family protein [Defluviitaleaceae bacterium]